MPKKDIDYSNTVFYKIYCKDLNIKDLYIGHTTNFVQRKCSHKRACTKEEDANHNLKVYNYIRDNGGWNNWKMNIIGFHECYDHYEARKIEQSYFESLHATLNSIEPLPKPKPKPLDISKEKKEKHIWYCNECNITCQSEKQFNIHQETKKHKRNLNSKENSHSNEPENSRNFICEECNFKCSKQSNYNKHLLTRKHTILTNSNETNKEMLYECECGKKYKHSSTLSQHKKKCKNNSIFAVKKSDELDYKELLLQVIKQLHEQQEKSRQKDEIIMEKMMEIVSNTTQL